MRLSELRGKLVILDLWNTHCGACIAAFPHLYALQEQFADSLTVMPVCMLDSKADVQKFYARRPALRFSSAVVEDTLDALFTLIHPDSYPHEVWLDEHRVVRAITYAADVSAENVRALLTQNKQLAVKKRQVAFDGNSSGFLYRSMITGYNDSVSTYGVLHYHDSSVTRVYGFNLPILEFLLARYPQFSSDIYHKRLIIKGSEDTDYYFNRPAGMDAAAYREKVLYGYDLVLPASFSKAEADSIMFTDICRFFRLKVYTKKEVTDCLILYKTGAIPQSRQPESLDISDDGLNLRMQHGSMKALLAFFDKDGWPPVVDETGFGDVLDATLSIRPTLDLENIDRQLKPYGLAIRLAKRNIDMLVMEQS